MSFPYSWNAYVENERRARIQEAKFKRAHPRTYEPELPKPPVRCDDCGLLRVECISQERGWHPRLDICDVCYAKRRRAQWAEAQAMIREYRRPFAVKVRDRDIGFSEKTLCPDCLVSESEDGEFLLTLCKICQYHATMLTKITDAYAIPRPQLPHISVLTKVGEIEYAKYQQALKDWSEKSSVLTREKEEKIKIVLGYWKLVIAKKQRRARNARYQQNKTQNVNN